MGKVNKALSDLYELLVDHTSDYNSYMERRRYNNKRVPNTLKQAREEMGLTQGELAKKLDVTISTISKLECGQMDIGMPLIDKLQDFLEETYGEEAYGL